MANAHYEDGRLVYGDDGVAKSMSDDMALGVLLYSLKTRDVGALNRWFNWMSTDRKDFCYGRSYREGTTGARGCLGIEAKEIVKYCPHINCTVQPVHRDVDDAVWSFLVGTESPNGIGNYYRTVDLVLGAGAVTAVFIDYLRSGTNLIAVPLGLPSHPCIKDTMLTPFRYVLPGLWAVDLLNKYKNLSGGDKLKVEACLGASGFPRHKVAVRAKILVDINHHSAPAAAEALRIIADKEPNNAFYQYLVHGPTEDVRRLTEDYCPKRRSDVAASMLTEWIWEQGPGDYTSASWTKPYSNFLKDSKSANASMIWDCILMRNFLGPIGTGLGFESVVRSESAPLFRLLIGE